MANLLELLVNAFFVSCINLSTMTLNTELCESLAAYFLCICCRMTYGNQSAFVTAGICHLNRPNTNMVHGSDIILHVSCLWIWSCPQEQFLQPKQCVLFVFPITQPMSSYFKVISASNLGLSGPSLPTALMLMWTVKCSLTAAFPSTVK